MISELFFSYGFSIWIAALLAIIRFSSIRKEYYPFVILVWVAALTELINYVLIQNGFSNIISSNVYSLMESLLWILFFKKLGVFERYKIVPFLLMGFYVMAWLLVNFIIHQFGTNYNSIFVISYAPIVDILGIHTLNGLLIKEKEIFRNPVFYICVGLVIYFTYMIVIEVFFIYGLELSANLSAKIYDIHTWINLLCNLIYALAIIWMRKKQAYTLQY